MDGRTITLNGGPRDGEQVRIFGGTSLHWPDAIYHQSPADPDHYTLTATRAATCDHCGTSLPAAQPRRLADGKGNPAPIGAG